jgi:excisionase family DNA binding protein
MVDGVDSVPLWKKYMLTITEASEYFGIGEKKLRQMVAENPEADYLLMNGKKYLIKRIKFEQMLDTAYSI